MTYEPNQSVLVVDDEPSMRAALRANFQRQGWTVETASGAEEAFRKFEHVPFPLVVTDIRMPDGDGLELMRAVRKASPATAVILLTAFGSVPEAVHAVRNGACDYLTKPISFDQLLATVDRLMLAGGNGNHAEAKAFGTEIVGRAPALVQALERARAAARTDADVLIEAESGTGKELFARYIHETSGRSAQPFVAINCAAVPEHLLESELFGHARGAFTGATNPKPGKFELANGGTLLLDEIGEMPLHLQPKLLRVLQEREFERLGETRAVRVNIRVIATTNVSLRARVNEGKFRTDLYYRLNVIPLTIPPLRQRREDIPLLAEFFAAHAAAQCGRAAPRLGDDFIEAIQNANWPGNVRELHNFIRRVVALYDRDYISSECLESEACLLKALPSATPADTETAVAVLPAAADATGQAVGFIPAASSRRLPEAHIIPGTPIRDFERQLLEKTLAMTNGNRTRTAELLGVSLRTIRNRIREYGLPPRRYA
jgi:DNA-binding NtrC family response regulator